MSQIKFTSEKDNRPVTVVTGWDRPLGYAHLTIFDHDDEVLFDGLDEPDIFEWDADRVSEKLDELGIDYPLSLPEVLYDHMLRNAGNEIIWLREENNATL